MTTFMTLGEFLEFAVHSPLRYEYVNGVIRAMTGPGLAHGRISRELLVAVDLVYSGPDAIAEFKSISLSMPLAQIYAGTLPTA